MNLLLLLVWLFTNVQRQHSTQLDPNIDDCQAIKLFIPRSYPKRIHQHTKYLYFYAVNKPLNYQHTYLEVTVEETRIPKDGTKSHVLAQGIDYQVDDMVIDNALPSHFHLFRGHNYTKFRLVLSHNRSWIGNRSKSLSTDAHLFAAAAFSCVRPTILEPKNVQRLSLANQYLVSIATKQFHCPQLPELPDATSKFSSFINNILKLCHHPKVLKSKLFDSQLSHILPLDLLALYPPLLLIDGTDEVNITNTGQRIDSYIAMNSVLEIVWEPYSKSDPNYWILMPRPSGMPGHYFAMFDIIQYHHQYVRDAHIFAKQLQLCLLQNELTVGENNSASDKSYGKLRQCHIGCPKTNVVRTTISGWGADLFHLSLDLFRAVAFNHPIQGGPARLNYSPIWGNDALGWTYTYGGCPSNYLDCYFLPHSPCPAITIDPKDHTSSLNRTRYQFAREDPLIQAFKDIRMPWWSSVMNPELTQSSGLNVVNNFPNDHPFEGAGAHALYSYWLRPKYNLRREVHSRAKDFNLDSNCAVLHVRRGDILMHTNSPRAYIPVEAYIRTAKRLLEYMSISTIFLLTDSQLAVHEAERCSRDFPNSCPAGLKFRYVTKDRYYAAEGGWENHIASKDARSELLNIQLEFALSHKCSLLISGTSNYADVVYRHMCCGYPLQERGRLPQRCVCPPRVALQQSGFDCNSGNALLCASDKNSKLTVWNRKFHELALKYSLNASTKISSMEVSLTNPLMTYRFHNEDKSLNKQQHYDFFIATSIKFLCNTSHPYYTPPDKPFCRLNIP